MAYTFAELYDIASIGTARTIEDSRKLYILNATQNFIWKKFDWRFTIAKLPSFWLVPYEQDYGRPIVVVPDNMEKLVRAQTVTWNENGVPVINKLDPRRELDPNNILGMPQQISFNSSERVLRLWPRPTGGMCAPNNMVQATYKTFPTLLTTANYQTTSVPSSDGGNFDSQIQMWVEVLRYIYQTTVGDHQKAQQQFPIAMTALMEEVKNEGTNQGDPQIAPSESLLGGTGSYYGFFYP